MLLHLFLTFLGSQKRSKNNQKYRCTLLTFSEYLAPGARDPVNVDSKVAETVKRKLTQNPDRYCFDEAVVSNTVHILYRLYS